MKYTIIIVLFIAALGFFLQRSISKISQKQEQYEQCYYTIKKAQLDSSVVVLGSRAEAIKLAVDSGQIPDEDKNRAIIEFYELSAKKLLLEEIKTRHESK